MPSEVNPPLLMLGIIMVLLSPIFIAVIWAWFSAKKEVDKTPKEPMLICDIHGFYPAKYSIKMEVPGMTTGPVDMCPFCYNERVSKKKVL